MIKYAVDYENLKWYLTYFDKLIKIDRVFHIISKVGPVKEPTFSELAKEQLSFIVTTAYSFELILFVVKAEVTSCSS